MEHQKERNMQNNTAHLCIVEWPLEEEVVAAESSAAHC